MATDLSGSNYSETDASNNNASPNGMPEGMASSGVNDAWRQGMGAIKRAWDRDHATATVGGTANAITLTYTTGPASYVQGEKFAFLATAANTGATTVNVSGLGVKNIYALRGGTPAALLGGEIANGQIVELEYDGTQFQLLNRATWPSFQAFQPAAGSTIAAGATVFFGPIGASVTEAAIYLVMPFSGIARNLYIVTGTAPVGAETFTYTARKNGVDQAVTAQITGAANTANDATHSFSFVAGDVITVKLVTSASAAITTHCTTMEFDRT